jgi:hypothetical protein
MKNKDFEARCEMTLHVPKIDPIVEYVMKKVGLADVLLCEKVDKNSLNNQNYDFRYLITFLQKELIIKAVVLASYLDDNEHCAEKDYVITELYRRSQIGIKKYGTTLFESKESLQAFVKHTFEEVLDTINYAEKILSILNNAKI